MTRCLVCNADNPPGARVCGTCGAALSGDPATGFSNALPPGTQLQGGAYAVGRVLGQGGFGITYLGSDASARRPVAIKELFPYGSARRGLEVHPGPEMSVADYATTRRKFLDETRVLARFNHPGIVQVYDTFEQNNTAYMVMEFLRGRSLGKLIEERGPLPEWEAVDYITRAGQALEEVHRTSILHRDLKPDNIMLTDDGRVVLIDFGTARTFAAGMTGRMTTMVTPGYAPLEQYSQQVRFGPFTDVYALAATLYHLVTGQMPASATDRATGIDLKPPRALNPAVSAAVSDAVEWAMEMRVDRRPQSVRAFLAALEPAMSAAEPIAPEPLPPPPPDPTPPPAPRRGPPTWLPPIPDGAPYDVEVSGDQIAWPDHCVCCFEQPDTTYLVQHTGASGPFSLFEETRGWEMPYCSACVEHVNLGVAPSGPGAGALGGLALGTLLGGPVGLLIGLGAMAGSVAGAVKKNSRLNELLKPTCVAIGPAAAYLGWEGNTHAFTFLNRDYAEAFSRENAARLVA